MRLHSPGGNIFLLEDMTS